jgi:hypothetical protein
MRRGRHVPELELGDDADGVQDRAELAGDALDLVVGESEPREPRDVEHLFTGNRHGIGSSQTTGEPRQRPPLHR